MRSGDREKHSTSAIFVQKVGRILLIKRLAAPDKGWWAIPGGHVDEGETPKEAAEREASEEIRGVMIVDGPDPVFEHDVSRGGLCCRHRQFR